MSVLAAAVVIGIVAAVVTINKTRVDQTSATHMVLVEKNDLMLFSIPAKQDFPPLRITARDPNDVQIEVTTAKGERYRAVWQKISP